MQLKLSTWVSPKIINVTLLDMFQTFFKCSRTLVYESVSDKMTLIK